MSEQIKYGKYFGRLLTDIAVSIWDSDFQRDRNSGAPFRFGENHLRKAARCYVPPVDWPLLEIERCLANDIGEDGRPHGGIDYFFSPPDQPRISDLKQAVATCEIGGPTRPAMLRGSRVNWYPKIVEDIRKQVGRARTAPNGQHYLGLFIQPARNSDVERDLNSVIKSMLVGVPDAQLITSYWEQLQQLMNLNIVVFRVKQL